MKIAVAFISGLIILSAHAAPATKSAARPKKDPIALAHDNVKNSLKDPDSARFKGDFIGANTAVCGEVNAKNSYGGYGGFRRYISQHENVWIESSSGDDSWKMDSRWYELCSEYESKSK